MDFASCLAGLRREGALLADAARRADPAARPAGCPDWDVEDVVRHTGMVQRWATAVVRERRSAAGPDDPDTGAGLSGGALADWFAAGLDDLVATLAATGPADEIFTLLPSASPREFWARRQLHETAIHRADVESVSGPVTPFPLEAALDGIAEAIALGAAPKPHWPGPDRTLHLHPTDLAPGARLPDAAPSGAAAGVAGVAAGAASGGVTVRVGVGGVVAAPGVAPDCVVRGSASDLFLLLWNRPAGGLEVSGDPAVLVGWAGAVRVRWHSELPPRRGTIDG